MENRTRTAAVWVIGRLGLALVLAAGLTSATAQDNERVEPAGSTPQNLRADVWDIQRVDVSKRFSRMTDAQKDASLEAWMTSRLALRRMAFLALRNLALLGYYSQPETWPLIGYQGPLIERSEKP